MKTIFTMMFCSICFLAFAQQNIHKHTDNDCGTLPPAKPYVITREMMQKALSEKTAATYAVKVFFHIVANDDGTNAACGDSSILRQLANARDFYAPQNMCFVLAGINQINNSDLNSHNTDTEEGELSPYLIGGCLNVFIHSSLFDNDGGLNGSAYAIPNTYLSMSSGAIKSASNRSTLAHEMGHDFNLFHTFETYYGKENVARSGSCMDCLLDGDLLCDTDADPNSGSYDVADYISNCVYTGTKTDDCGDTYQMDPHNIMTYGDRECRNIFTDGQGARARATVSNNAIFVGKLAPASLTVTSSISESTGTRIDVATGAVIINSSNYHIYGSCDAYLAGSSVTLKPGADLVAGAGGTSSVYVNTFCQ